MHIQSKGPTDEQILAALSEVRSVGQVYALKVVIAGALLLERYAQAAAQNGGVSVNGRNQYSGGGNWLKFVEDSGYAQRTAYRYMDTAKAVLRVLFQLPAHEAVQPVIELGGASVSYSHALTAPQKSLPAPVRKFQQEAFEFLEDKSLADVNAAAASGITSPGRIGSAVGGLKKGGSGEDEKANRKAFDRFVAKHLDAITSAVTTTKQQAEKVKSYHDRKISPIQQARIISAFNDAMKLWPLWLIESVLESAKVESKMPAATRAQQRTVQFGKVEQ